MEALRVAIFGMLAVLFGDWQVLISSWLMSALFLKRKEKTEYAWTEFGRQGRKVGKWD
jgi:hypothetical protein